MTTSADSNQTPALEDIIGGYEANHGRPKIFATDDDVVREANALYLNNTPLKWLDVGTRASAAEEPTSERDPKPLAGRQAAHNRAEFRSGRSSGWTT